ncbi:MAG: hypothetical protein INH41_21865 [Myxococcaceae bacterium]|nr:hypothetical protein [Myxococcaceae bacterium]
MEWLDDVRRWRAGDAEATERLREYVVPFVHGALLARLPHHLANQLTPEALGALLSRPDLVEAEAGFVRHAVALATQLAGQSSAASLQERPTSDTTRNEGRQWLERLRGLPDEVRERVIWRLVWGIPGPELCEVLGVEAGPLQRELERGVGDTMAPRQHLGGAGYVWDLSGEPSTALARAETYAMSLRFDPNEPPESADAAFTAATFQDLSDSVVTDSSSHGPARPAAPRVASPVLEARLPRSPKAGGFDADEKTQGAVDIPAAARGVVPKPDAQPASKSAPRAALAAPPERRADGAAAPVSPDDERSGRRRSLVAHDERAARRRSASSSSAADEDRQGRSRAAARARGDGEPPGRRREPGRTITTEAPAVAGARHTLELPAEDTARLADAPKRARQGPMPERQPASGPAVSLTARFVALGFLGVSLALAVLWRLGAFR